MIAASILLMLVEIQVEVVNRRQLYFKLSDPYCLLIWAECCYQELDAMHVNYGGSSTALYLITQSVKRVFWG